MSLDAYKFGPDRESYWITRPNPHRARRHVETECLETFGPAFRRLYMCPKCGEGYELDRESNAIGLTCCGDAVLEAR